MSNHPNRSKTCRPREHLVAAGKIYPSAWKQLDQFRASRGQDGLPDWPEWCFLPLAASYAVISAGGDNRLTPALVGDVGRLGALTAWRVTQGVYKFDETLLQSLIDTPVTGDLPVEVLHRLPEWCVYIETPGLSVANTPLGGFFAHLEWDANTGREELRLVLDLTMPDGYMLLPIPVHLGGSLSDGIQSASEEAQRQAWRAKSPETADTIRGARLEDIGVEPLISLLLYLCSVNAEIGNNDKRPELPRPKRTKKGWRLFPADKPTTWDVGVRLGAALRHGYTAAQGEGETRAGPRAHIRRAHWHTYRIGPGKAESVLKWLPPIPVNVDDLDGLPATVRPVK
jgi:hypothetical protein